MKKITLIIFVLFLSSVIVNANSLDSLKKKDSINTSGGKKEIADTTKKNPVQIDTTKIVNQIDTTSKDNVKKIDSLITNVTSENKITNTKLFVYILLSLLGISFFFFIFVQSLFKTFHKTRSTRQSMMLSWNLFFIVSIIWIMIIWGFVAGFWNYAALMVVLVFLLIISLIMLIVALKSK